jgi:hypothetical protein
LKPKGFKSLKHNINEVKTLSHLTFKNYIKEFMPALYQFLDQRQQTMRVSFIPSETIHQNLINFFELPWTKPFVIEYREKEKNYLKKNEGAKEYRLTKASEIQKKREFYFKNDFKQLLEFKDIHQGTALYKLIERLCAHYGTHLINNDVEISTLLYGEVLNVDSKSVSRMRKSLVKAGLFELADDSYIANCKAKKYRTTKLFKQLVNLSQVESKSVIIPNPSHLSCAVQGETNQLRTKYLPILCRHYGTNIDAIVNWFNQIQNYGTKDRLHEIRLAAKSFNSINNIAHFNDNDLKIIKEKEIKKPRFNTKQDLLDVLPKRVLDLNTSSVIDVMIKKNIDLENIYNIINSKIEHKETTSHITTNVGMPDDHLDNILFLDNINNNRIEDPPPIKDKYNNNSNKDVDVLEFLKTSILEDQKSVIKRERIERSSIFD